MLHVPDTHAHAAYSRAAWFAPAAAPGAVPCFYAGVALRSPSGHAVGTLAVLDMQPRELSARQLASLARLARQAVCVLELGRAVVELRAANAALLGAARERDRLREARAAARADLVAERKLFVDLVADEVRAPLNGIADGVSRLALSDAPPEQEVLDFLAVGCTHLQLTVNSILDYGVVADSFRLMPEAVDLQRAVLAPSLRLLQYMHNGAAVRFALAGGAQLLHSVAPGVPARVVCDASRIVAVVTKLLNNGLKYVALDGTGAVSLAVRADAGWLSFVIHDNGCGIAPAALPTILLPAASPAAKGTSREGGLLLCKRLAAAMGGDLLAASDGLGCGATFTLQLPLVLPPGAPPHAQLSALNNALVCVIGSGEARMGGIRRRSVCEASTPSPSPATSRDLTAAVVPTAAAAAAAAEGPAAEELKPGQRRDGAALRILVAEDDRVSQVIVRKLLKHVGAEVTLVGDGAAAVEAYRASPDAWDLILLDMNMPVLSGPDAARALIALGSTIPMVALTASAGPDAVKRCLDSGMVGHLAKPVRPETLSTLRPFSERRKPADADKVATKVWLATKGGAEKPPPA